LSFFATHAFEGLMANSALEKYWKRVAHTFSPLQNRHMLSKIAIGYAQAMLDERKRYETGSRIKAVDQAAAKALRGLLSNREIEFSRQGEHDCLPHPTGDREVAIYVYFQASVLCEDLMLAEQGFEVETEPSFVGMVSESFEKV
jgi:hypothetical protein